MTCSPSIRASAGQAELPAEERDVFRSGAVEAVCELLRAPGNVLTTRSLHEAKLLEDKLRNDPKYEELLIEAESEATPHPLICRAQERSLPPEELWPKLDALEAVIAAQDVNAALALLAELVPEWQREGSTPQSESSATSSAAAQ